MDYQKVDFPVVSCPFCGETEVRYSITVAANDYFYGQCYCNKCKAAGPRVRFKPPLVGNTWGRHCAEKDFYAKNDAIALWNSRKN